MIVEIARIRFDMAGLKVDRFDSRCALCREAEADKTGSHLAPNFMIHGMFSFDGKGRRNREISMRDHLNRDERMFYYGPEVSPDSLKGEDEFEMRRILDENVTSLEEILKGDNDLGDFGYILWRVKGLQKGDSGIFGTRREQSPYMIIVNDTVALLIADVSKYRKHFSYAGWKIDRDDLNTFDCDGEVVNEISLEDFAQLKRFVIDESKIYGWGAAQEKVKIHLRELDRTEGVLHSVGYNEEKEALRMARVEDDASPRPLFLRNSYKFHAAELKEYT